MGTSFERTSQHDQKTIGAPDPPPRAESTRPVAHRLLGLLGIASILAVGAWWWSIGSSLERAQRAAARGEWDAALDLLNDFLEWYPDDETGRLLIAEACVKSPHSDPAEAARQAIAHLKQIGEDSPQASVARMQEGRLALLLLKEPGRAERALRESLRLQPNSLETNLLLWKLLDVTGRHILSHPYFWKVYELSPDSKHPALLRDWFLSEFYPETLYDDLYQRLGAKAAGKIPASISLMAQFRENEPDASFLHAALANYYLDLGNLNSTMELLKETPDLEQAMKDPLYVSVLFEALIDLGKFQKARDCFGKYPQPHEGYLFWRTEGMFQDHVQRDNAAAVKTYRKALTTGPAKFDWGLMSRLSVCLRKNGETAEARGLQLRVDRLTTEVLTVKRTSRLRSIIDELENPEVAHQLRDFYAEFGLEREMSAWQQHEMRLRSGKKVQK